MLGKIHWLGHDSFRLDGTVTIYIDPWKLPAGLPPADLILVTHEHFDHLAFRTSRRSPERTPSWWVRPP